MHSSILKAILLKDVDFLPLVFSKGWVGVRKFYGKRKADPKSVCGGGWR